MSNISSQFKETQRFLESKFKGLPVPSVVVVCGSGLGSLVNILKNPFSIPYKEIPHFLPTRIPGHEGKLYLGKIEDSCIAILQGRIHRYEGHALSEVVYAIRSLIDWGVHTVVLTNASGGINTRFRVGDLMLIEDHLNLTGENVLEGPNLPQGPRFPDLSEAWDPSAFKILADCAEIKSIPVQKGIYAGLKGPTYETHSEVKMLRLLGGDACGMSTVQECIASVHFGARVAGICVITNLAAGMEPVSLTHEEVLEIGGKAAEKMASLLKEALPRLAKLGKKGK